MKWYRSPWILRGSLLFLFGMFVVIPLTRVLVGSLESLTPYHTINLFIFVKRYLSLDQYKNILFHDLEYWAAFWNTILLTLPTVLLAIGIGAMTAYGLRIIHKKICSVLLIVYAVLSTLPAQILMVPHLVVLSSLFLTGTRLAVILVGCCSPWYVFFLHQLCVRIPEEELEAARLEGASEREVFSHIVLPQMRLGATVFAIVIAADLWGMVEEPLIYIQDTTKYPISVTFHEMGTSLSFAGVVLFSLPVLVILVNGVLDVVRSEIDNPVNQARRVKGESEIWRM